MKTNAEGLRLIKQFEGLRLEAYADAVGVLTIGYGHTRGVQPGDTIGEADAERLLREDIAATEAALAKLIAVPVNGNEFSALVSLAYNIGAANFAKSSVLRRLNADERTGAADAILLWVKGRVSGKLVRLEGLARRRAAERALFLKPEQPA
jgi:lysozyme